jgi:hypothetical protein
VQNSKKAPTKIEQPEFIYKFIRLVKSTNTQNHIQILTHYI